MKMYFAGALGFEFNHDRLRQTIKNRLLSYHYMQGNLNERYYKTYRADYENIVVDSGAFSVWNKGDVIDIDKYIDYCLGCNENVDYFVNLDVIPARPGLKQIPQEEIERSASSGYDNYYRMAGRGIPKEKLIHVFHQNEDFKWLKKMVGEMEYIGLSPANDRTTKEKIEWLHTCMPYVTDSEGRAIVKFHGFAVTSFKLMKYFPWHSVDSATWGIAAGLGRVFIPKWKKGAWDFGAESPMIWTISQVQDNSSHIMHQRKNIRADVLRYLDSLGLQLGDSSFREVPPGYVCQEGEKFVTKRLGIAKSFEDEVDTENFEGDIDKRREQMTRDPDMSTKRTKEDESKPRWIETIKEPGVLNSVMQRQFLNVHYMHEFSKTLPVDHKWIKDEQRAVGFGF